MTVQGATTSPPDPFAVDRRSNFGRRGWSIVGIEGLLIWLAAGIQVHGLNIMVPVLSEHFAIEASTFLYWATPATWGGVLAGWVVAKTSDRWGPKINILVCLFGAAIAFGFLGTWGTVTGFAVLFFLVNFFGSGFGYVGGIQLVTNWFPRKKNLALGWVTMGQTMSTALFVPMLALFFGIFGVQNAFWVVSAILLVLGVVVLVFVKNLPEEAGCSPDNIPMTPAQIAASRAEQEAYVSPFTTRDLLKMKDVWLILIGTGGIYVVLVGMLSQMVPRMIEMGIPQNQAILNMSIAAFIGVPGAYAWGWIGQKFSSRVACMFYAGWWGLAVVVNMLATNQAVLWVSLVMIGFSFGGATSLTTSIVADKFRRGSFIKAYAIIHPASGIIRSFAYAILAFGLTNLGGYTGAYGLLVGIAVLNIVLFYFVNPKPVDDAPAIPAAASTA